MRLIIAAALCLASPALAAPAVDTAAAEAVIQRCLSIYREPVNGKSHPCACPFNKDKRGASCGLRSAHDRANGAEPVCLVTEVTPELLADFRTNAQAALRERCEYRGRWPHAKRSCQHIFLERIANILFYD